MQIDLSDKRVLAAAITAVIVIVAIIGVESFWLWARASPVAYQQGPLRGSGNTGQPVQAPGHLSLEDEEVLDLLAEKSLNGQTMSRKNLNRLDELIEQRKRQ